MAPDGRLARVVAVDVDDLVSISVHVRGVPLRSVRLRSLVRPARLQRWLSRIGAALAAVDSIPVPRDEAVHGAWHERVDPFLGHLPEVVGRYRADLVKDRLYKIGIGLETHGDTSFALGDVSMTNVLVEGDSVGFIDGSWLPRLRGFDLAVFSVRLEVMYRFAPRISSWMTRALGAAYSEHAPIPPGAEFERSQRLLRMLVTGKLPSARLRDRAIAELSGEVPHPFA